MSRKWPDILPANISRLSDEIDDETEIPTVNVDQLNGMAERVIEKKEEDNSIPIADARMFKLENEEYDDDDSLVDELRDFQDFGQDQDDVEFDKVVQQKPRIKRLSKLSDLSMMSDEGSVSKGTKRLIKKLKLLKKKRKKRKKEESEENSSRKQENKMKVKAKPDEMKEWRHERPSPGGGGRDYNLGSAYDSEESYSEEEEEEDEIEDEIDSKLDSEELVLRGALVNAMMHSDADDRSGRMGDFDREINEILQSTVNETTVQNRDQLGQNRMKSLAEITFEGTCESNQDKDKCESSVALDCKSKNDEYCSGLGSCKVHEEKNGFCCSKLECPLTSVQPDKCQKMVGSNETCDDTSDDCLRTKLERCPEGGRCVHFRSNDQCCYKIACDEKPKDVKIFQGQMTRPGVKVVPVSHPRECNRMLCPILPQVCPQEGSCLVKSNCGKSDGGKSSNCSCRVEVKCFDNDRHAFEIEYEFDESTKNESLALKDAGKDKESMSITDGGKAVANETSGSDGMKDRIKAILAEGKESKPVEPKSKELSFLDEIEKELSEKPEEKRKSKEVVSSTGDEDYISSTSEEGENVGERKPKPKPKESPESEDKSLPDSQEKKVKAKEKTLESDEKGEKTISQVKEKDELKSKEETKGKMRKAQNRIASASGHKRDKGKKKERSEISTEKKPGVSRKGLDQAKTQAKTDAHKEKEPSGLAETKSKQKKKHDSNNETKAKDDEAKSSKEVKSQSTSEMSESITKESTEEDESLTSSEESVEGGGSDYQKSALYDKSGKSLERKYEFGSSDNYGYFEDNISKDIEELSQIRDILSEEPELAFGEGGHHEFRHRSFESRGGGEKAKSQISTRKDQETESRKPIGKTAIMDEKKSKEALSTEMRRKPGGVAKESSKVDEVPEPEEEDKGKTAIPSDVSGTKADDEKRKDHFDRDYVGSSEEPLESMAESIEDALQLPKQRGATSTVTTSNVTESNVTSPLVPRGDSYSLELMRCVENGGGKYYRERLVSTYADIHLQSRGKSGFNVGAIADCNDFTCSRVVENVCYGERPSCRCDQLLG
jgi:hypothetical protein